MNFEQPPAPKKETDIEKAEKADVYLKITSESTDSLIQTAIDNGVLYEGSKWAIGNLCDVENIPEGEYYLVKYKGVPYRVTNLDAIPTAEQQATAPTVKEILSYVLYGRNLEIPPMIENDNLYKMLSAQSQEK